MLSILNQEIPSYKINEDKINLDTLQLICSPGSGESAVWVQNWYWIQHVVIKSDSSHILVPGHYQWLEQYSVTRSHWNLYMTRLTRLNSNPKMRQITRLDPKFKWLGTTVESNDRGITLWSALNFNNQKTLYLYWVSQNKRNAWF